MTKKLTEEQRMNKLARQKVYREENKEMLAERRKARFLCECGDDILLHDKARHLRTDDHKNKIDFINDPNPTTDMMICICGSFIKKTYHTRHIKSEKHKNYFQHDEEDKHDSDYVPKKKTLLPVRYEVKTNPEPIKTEMLEDDDEEENDDVGDEIVYTPPIRFVPNKITNEEVKEKLFKGIKDLLGGGKKHTTIIL